MSCLFIFLVNSWQAHVNCCVISLHSNLRGFSTCVEGQNESGSSIGEHDSVVMEAVNHGEDSNQLKNKCGS